MACQTIKGYFQQYKISLGSSTVDFQPNVMPYPPKRHLKQLQCSFRVDRSGLDPNEFEASLTSKVDELFKFHGISNIETSVKQKAVKTVKQQVCVQKSGKHYIRLLDDDDTTGVFSHKHQSCDSRVKDKREWKSKCHIKQHQLLTDTLGKKFEPVRVKYGILNETNHDGQLVFDERPLKASEFCNVIDLLTADIIKDLSKLKRENWNTGEPTIDFKKVFDLCEDILLDRYTAQRAANNDFMNEDDYQVWKAHVMVMMSFAALMTVAEMTRNEFNKHLAQKGPRYLLLVFLIIIYIGLPLFLSNLPNRYV
ncbi:uncharacterized protein LOC122948364 isoform X1 [Acropora millepora]|uniref:uncharacterized protein LOC122948364 isoform X1 n=2 Tax=Acropora millepora TaxID=45264 RepID=UPI001CF495C0|nr:uncharacterized protein LOC122948364 isoform X1 [Acropora millepora]